MRRLFILVIVALISISPLGGFLASGQEPEPAYWNGVSLSEEPVDPGPLEEFLVGVPLGDPDSDRMRSIGTRLPDGFRFDFQFDPNAQTYRPQVPEIEDAESRKTAEFMVVIVDSGDFVLTILPSSPAFIVDPPEDTTISYMDVTGEWADPPNPGFTYAESNRVVLDENGQECMNLCTVSNPATELPPSAENVVAVQLKEGSRVQALAGNFCLWCLINGQANSLGQEEGSLLVYPYTENDQEFSWVRSYEEAQLASPEGVEFIQGDPASFEAAPVGMAWAFNPPSGCH
jgi:hypothetical protein